MAWAQTYGGGLSYSTGLRGDQMVVTKDLRASFVTPPLYNTDWSYSVWVDTSDHTIDNTTHFAMGNPTLTGTNPYAGVAVRTPAGSGITAQAFMYDGSYHTSSYISVTPDASGRIMFSVVYDNTAKTLSVYANGDATPFATTSLAAILVAIGTYALCAMYATGANGAPFDLQHKAMDEWGVFGNYKFTAADIAYLYNSGLGKTYAEVMADSVL